MSAEVLERPATTKKATKEVPMPTPPQIGEVPESASARRAPAAQPKRHGVTMEMFNRMQDAAGICKAIVAHVVAAGYTDRLVVRPNTLRHSLSFAHDLLSEIEDQGWEGHVAVHLDQLIATLNLFMETGFEVDLDTGTSELAFSPELVSDMAFGLTKLVDRLIEALAAEDL